MTVMPPSLPIATARFDTEGRLIEADERLSLLNAAAGGSEGARFAVPPIAAIVSLCGRLGIAIARTVTVADEDDDVDLMIRAEPDDDGIRLTATGWQAQPAGDAIATRVRRDADFLRATADWLWDSDAQLRLRFISPAAGKQLGVDPATLVGQPLTRLFVLAEGEDGEFPMLAALAAQTRFDDQPATLRATGEAVMLSASPVTDAGGRFAGFTGAVRRVETEAEAEAAPAADGEALAEALGARLDRALRLPLGRIVANADSIAERLDGPLGEDYAGYAADIAAAGRHLLGLVDDLVDLQAIERPDFTAAREPIDVADVAGRAAGLLSVRASDARVTIDRTGLHSPLPAIGEFRRALQVMVNLIGNAVRYSPEGGVIWLRGERDGDFVRVMVADQGKGIASADQARIFEKFARVDPSEPGGSGLGLYISRKLARAMGGDITVDSAPGEGARFVFRLPAGE